MMERISAAVPIRVRYKNPASAGFFILLVACFWFSGKESITSQAQRERELVAPPRGLEHFHFGFRTVMADSFWVRAIQDFDFCEKEVSKRVCVGRGWLFQTLDVVTDLDPQFRMAYSAGGMALSVIISDIEGASRLFAKGVTAFPKDWTIAYKAAYNALYEEKNTVKAAVLMEQAAKNGAPDWVYQLAGRLYTRAGRRELAERLLSEITAQGVDESVQSQLRQRLQEKMQAEPEN